MSIEFPLIPNIKVDRLVYKTDMSTVYQGVREIDGLKVACKIIEKNSSVKFTERLEREISLLKRLDHPNIIKLVDLIDEIARTIIITKYEDSSMDLYDYLTDIGALSKKEAMKVFSQLVSALKYCHDQNIVHRDLKIENILIDPKTHKIKLIDLGFGRDLPEEDADRKRLVDSDLGSVECLSPERFSKEPYDAKKSDVWALGVILFVMIVCDMPFGYGNDPDVIDNILNGDFKIPNELDKETADLISFIFNPDPSARPSLDEIIQKYGHCFADTTQSNTDFESDSKQK